jgi:hypothetical protein
MLLGRILGSKHDWQQMQHELARPKQLKGGESLEMHLN